MGYIKDDFERLANNINRQHNMFVTSDGDWGDGLDCEKTNEESRAYMAGLIHGAALALDENPRLILHMVLADQTSTY